MRRSPRPLVLAFAAALACRSAPIPGSAEPSGLDAATLFEGRADAGAVMDTTDEKSTISLVERARWAMRTKPNPHSDFWSDIALLDLPSADLVATSVEQRTFAAALRTLMAGDPEAAAVAFETLRNTSKDSLVLTRSRIGLTMALSWNSDWSALARIESQPDTGNGNADRLRIAAGVEKWARALSMMPTPEYVIPPGSVTLPMRRSPFGTPVAHGYLTLSLIPVMAYEIGAGPEGVAAGINYGLDKVRFLTPVKVGSRVRLHAHLLSFERKAPGQYLMKQRQTIDIEGGDRPALIAETLTMLVAG